jgi:predicted nuclease of predicted toxin-antitoxin system
MRLLFDQNLLPKLAPNLADIFPGSSHVMQEDLGKSTDELVWKYANQNGYTIVSKDSDFSNLSVIHGSPPQVIWLLLGNCTTAEVEKVIRAHHEAIEIFGQDPSVGTLAIG